MNIIFKKEALYLSTLYLKSLKINENTVAQWRKRRVGKWIKPGNLLYICLDTIPVNTRKKLPSEDAIFKEYQAQQDQQDLYEHLNAAKLLHWHKYKSIYQKDPSLSSEQVTRFAQLHSVLQAIIDLKENGFRDLLNLHAVFDKLYPGKYSTKHALANAIRKALCDGVVSIALDKRTYGNNREANRNKEISLLTRFWLTVLTAHSSKLSCSQIREKIELACNEKKFKVPSLSWVKLHRKESLKNVEVYKSRYGTIEAKNKMPYASLINAEKIHEQWQMDGWTLPFWSKGFKRFVLVRLVDAKSKMIVGFAVGASEDSALIMEAIRDAVNNTGVLPYEILTDNHVFNQTNEAQNLQRLFAQEGARWTITENPQYKAIIERYNQYLDAECKSYYGYLGQGIRSKSIEALANSDLITEYAKNFLSEEEIKGISIAIIESYNNKPLVDGKSPVQLYKESYNEHAIEVDVFKRAKLLVNTTEKKIIRGQITIKRGITKHEFQLPGALFKDYNDAIVNVRYDDLRDGVYLYHRATDEGIVFLPPKSKIHLAKINQTDEDIEALNKNAGRIKGIKHRAIKELEELTEKAHEHDPEAYAIINRVTAPKNLISELAQNAHLQQQAEDKGLRVKSIYVPERKTQYMTSALKPKEKERQSPFIVKNNQIKIIDPSKEFDEKN